MERYPQMKTEILGEEPAPMHFVHQKSLVMTLGLRDEKPELAA
jgi:hypothetical protein